MKKKVYVPHVVYRWLDSMRAFGEPMEGNPLQPAMCNPKTGYTWIPFKKEDCHGKLYEYDFWCDEDE